MFFFFFFLENNRFLFFFYFYFCSLKIDKRKMTETLNETLLEFQDELQDDLINESKNQEKRESELLLSPEQLKKQKLEEKVKALTSPVSATQFYPSKRELLDNASNSTKFDFYSFIYYFISLTNKYLIFPLKKKKAKKK